MNHRYRQKSLIQIMEEKEKCIIPNKNDIKKDLEDLTLAIKYTEDLIENEDYKPLDNNSINKLASLPQSKCIKDAFIYSIIKKIENIIEKNKSNFDNDFKTEISNYCITIYYELEKRLSAINFDISEQPPVLESTIYTKDTITNEKNNLQAAITKLQKEIDAEIEESKNAQIEYEKMEKNPNNFIKYNDYENFHPSDPYEQPRYISKIDKQAEKIKSIWHNICIKQSTIEDYRQKIKELEQLEEKSKNMNLNDFVILRSKLLEELGINDLTQDIPIIHPEEGLKESKTYKIGKHEYSIKYEEKTMKLK